MAGGKKSQPPLPQKGAGSKKFGVVMREHAKGQLHMGKTGKVVPKSRPDVAKAIAASESRKAAKKG